MLLIFYADCLGTTYTRVPFYMTNYQRGFLLESLQYSVFDLTQKTSVTLVISYKLGLLLVEHVNYLTLY